ncbi:MAG: hypothetical protein EBV06_10955 [Planctomycetia bacterium]|nr:hypothetical protein [Planctomycetia bacterium]
MNLLCPNCQKMLTVPEQYAGQLMKCPMCVTNFTVPALPTSTPGTPPSSPAPAFNPAPPTSPPAPPPIDVYGLKKEPAFSPPPVPAFATNPPSSTSPSTIEPTKISPPSPTTSLPPSTTGYQAGEYSDNLRVVFDPKILQWVPAVALLLVFVLQFFPWIGVYVGGRDIMSQGAWGAAVGSWTKPDSDLTAFFSLSTDKEAQKDFDDKNASGNEPGFSLLLFLYLMPLFFVTLAASAGVVALPYIQTPLPPQVQQVLPWKWAIVAGLNGLVLLFILLQFVLPFSLESRVAGYVASNPKWKEDAKAKSDVQKTKEAERAEYMNRVQRTTWWALVVLLHLVAAGSAGLVYWIEKRGPSKPLPALELKW